MDLRADLQNFETILYNDTNEKYSFKNISDILLLPHNRVLINTGLKLELPENIEAQIRSRSGLSLKQGLVVANGVGTIDPDYRGYIKVILLNTSNASIRISHGDRIAQLVFNRVEKLFFETVSQLSETERNEGGFGHTGKN
jgi:dUTP pyrophosphatase